jgi:hypothetical protein
MTYIHILKTKKQHKFIFFSLNTSMETSALLYKSLTSFKVKKKQTVNRKIVVFGLPRLSQSIIEHMKS